MARRFFRCVALALAFSGSTLSVGATRVRAQPAAVGLTMSVAVDASHATRGILHVRESIPVVPGPLTLDYPTWIPGEHSPSGPLADLAGIEIMAGSTQLAWARDLVDLYAIHVDVPAGTSALEVRFDFLGAGLGRYSSARLASATILVLTWHKVLLTPRADDYRTITIAPSLVLPGADWLYATALDTVTRAGAALTFAPVTMEQLVDSPLDAGTNVRKWPLGSIDGAPVDIAVFADAPENLEAGTVIPKLRALVMQMRDLYRARHFNHYTFLLTVSNVLPGEGVEHHQSSDNGTVATFLTDPNETIASADLLAHEFNHSWDGKFRRPFDLATPNLRVPMKDDLLWVYEGMTQFYGFLQAVRSGMLTPAQYRDHLALTYARLDSTTGRTSDPLLDTATEASILYGAPQAFSSQRRSVDFYDEGELMWLEADLRIRKLSGGRKSIDDFARAFFGRTSTGPLVVPYTRADIIAGLDAVQHDDWAAFFAARIDAVAPHPPDPFAPGGWRVAYAPKVSALEKIRNASRKLFDARYSLGIAGGDAQVVLDVIDGSPAQRAGLAPGDKIVAVEGRSYTVNGELQSALDAALVRAEHGGPPVRILALGGGVYHDIVMPYDGGPRYPVLEPIPGAPDVIDRVSKPLER